MENQYIWLKLRKKFEEKFFWGVWRFFKERGSLQQGWDLDKLPESSLFSALDSVGLSTLK
jgi:hypothetical protein